MLYGISDSDGKIDKCFELSIFTILSFESNFNIKCSNDLCMPNFTLKFNYLKDEGNLIIPKMLTKQSYQIIIEEKKGFISEMKCDCDIGKSTARNWSSTDNRYNILTNYSNTYYKIGDSSARIKSRVGGIQNNSPNFLTFSTFQMALWMVLMKHYDCAVSLQSYWRWNRFPRHFLTIISKL